MKAIITTDLSFGDSGKGATVDYLCRKFPVDLVVRYSGGAQCGHNVVLPDGTHHCFSQFGSGTLNGVPTYLDRQVIIDPAALAKEYQALRDYDPQITIHPECLVITPFHILANQKCKKTLEHGTVGRGVGKTKEYWLKYGSDALKVKDIGTPDAVEKLHLMRHRYLLEGLADWECDPTILARSLQRFAFYKVDYEKPKHEFAVYEAAQGILLDEYFGFWPNNTWTSVTSFEVDDSQYDDTLKLGITRCYHTRHGNGPFPTEAHIEIKGEHNKQHEFQGHFRTGYLDTELLRYALEVDPPDVVAVTCLDHKIDKVCTKYDYPILYKGIHGTKENPPERNLWSARPIYQDCCPLEAIKLHASVALTSDGPTWEHRSGSIDF